MSNINWSKLKTADDILFKKQVQEKFIEYMNFNEQLASTDYVTLSDYDKEKPEILKQRAVWRTQIREIESWFEEKGLSKDNIDEFLSET